VKTTGLQTYRRCRDTRHGHAPRDRRRHDHLLRDARWNGGRCRDARPRGRQRQCGVWQRRGRRNATGAITVTSAADLTAAAITAASLTHTAGTGTATFNGAQAYDTAIGLNVVTKAIALNQSVTTTNAGIVTLNADNGSLAIAAAGDIVADAVVTLSGSTGISTAGDVTTTNDNVVYTSDTTLAGPIAVNTGAGAGAISFNGTLDGRTTSRSPPAPTRSRSRPRSAARRRSAR